MSTETFEEIALERVADKYRQLGYAVVLQPGVQDLPEFLAGYRPDMVARGATESVVIDLKFGTETSVAERYRELAERIEGQPGWKFLVVFVNPDEPNQPWDAELPSLPRMKEKAAQAEGLVASGEGEAAFLLLWNVLEGALRTLSSRNHLAVENLPLSALVRELYSSGELSMQLFDDVMGLLPTRNKLAHGFDADDLPQAIDVLLKSVHALLAELEA